MHRHRLLATVAALPLSLVVLAGCGSDDADDPADSAAGTDTSSSAGGFEVDPNATPTPSGGAGGAGGSGDGAARQQDAVDAVVSIAPALESEVRGETYPMTLAEAKARIEKAGLSPASPLVVGGYSYHADDVEFALCIEDPATGAFATYDTGPMAPGQSGASGGCSSADLD